MAKKKKIKKSVKKSKLSTGKKTIKKKITVKASKKEETPLSIRCCNLIMEETPIEEIAETLAKEYPDCKHNGIGIVKYYVRFIKIGRMAKRGYNPESIPAMYLTDERTKTQPKEEKITKTKTSIKKKTLKKKRLKKKSSLLMNTSKDEGA